jgi:hypothetical protein
MPIISHSVGTDDAPSDNRDEQTRELYIQIRDQYRRICKDQIVEFAYWESRWHVEYGRQEVVRIYAHKIHVIGRAMEEAGFGCKAIKETLGMGHVRANDLF